MEEDRTLVASVLAARPGAFARLVEGHQRMVWHMLVRMVRNPADADDLAQETFLRVHRMLGQFRFESALSTWIGQIAFSLGSRFLRKKSIPLFEPGESDQDPLEGLSDGEDFAAGFADAELYQHVAAAMERLPTIQRTLLTLYHLEEQSIEAAATITGLPPGTVKSYLFRARARLRAEIEALLEPTQRLRAQGGTSS
jgi:RNA polymerase sigma-70 factor (ECF subfamily)